MVFVASMLIFMLLWLLFSNRFTVLVKVAVGIISMWAMWWYVQYTCDANQEAMYQYQLKRIEKDKAMRKKNGQEDWWSDVSYKDTSKGTLKTPLLRPKNKYSSENSTLPQESTKPWNYNPPSTKFLEMWRLGKPFDLDSNF